MSKRGNGEGSVYQRADGRWTAATYVLRPDGGRVRRQVYGKTRAEVSRQLAVLVGKTASGVPLAGETWTVASYADHWLEQVARPSLKPATVSSYQGMIRRHIVPSLGRVKLRSLTPAQVRRLLAERSAAGLSPRSVQIVHATLRAMLAEALRDELVERNVAAIVRAPGAVHDEVRPWSPEEAADFLRVAGKDRLHALFAVGIALGLRRGSCWAFGGPMWISTRVC